MAGRGVRADRSALRACCLVGALGGQKLVDERLNDTTYVGEVRESKCRRGPYDGVLHIVPQLGAKISVF